MSSCDELSAELATLLGFDLQSNLTLEVTLELKQGQWPSVTAKRYLKEEEVKQIVAGTFEGANSFTIDLEGTTVVERFHIMRVGDAYQLAKIV